MHTLEVIGELRGKVPTQYTFPGGWEECSVAQLGTIAALMSAGLEHARDDQMAECHMRLALLRELSNMPTEVFERLTPDDLLSLRADELDVQRVAFLPQLDWAVAEPSWGKSLVPFVLLGGQAWQGPTDRLGRMQLLQWGFCDRLLAALATDDADATTLHNLLGALYHPEGQPWDSDGIEERGRQLAQLSDRTKLAAVLNYRGLRANMASEYPRCFRSNGEADRRGMLGMLVRMAGPKFGTVQQAESANVHTVLVHVEQCMEEEDRQKAQQPNSR
jgi:hypothetical protein